MNIQYIYLALFIQIFFRKIKTAFETFIEAF